MRVCNLRDHVSAREVDDSPTCMRVPAITRTKSSGFRPVFIYDTIWVPSDEQWETDSAVLTTVLQY